MKPSLLAASILSADFSNLGDQIHQAEIAGVDWIHIDVMDGHFVPNITMGPFIVETVRKLTTLPIDVHLMIEKPENFISAFIKAGADYVSVHVECNSNIHRTIQSIRANHAKAGIVINPGTPASAAFALLPFVDYILLMSVNPGYSGQVFIPEVLNKIPELRKQCLELAWNRCLRLTAASPPKPLRLHVLPAWMYLWLQPPYLKRIMVLLVAFKHYEMHFNQKTRRLSCFYGF
jgi:ribulose-phosphate 3-epimerase